jgi:2-dehydropantoate 2-reductase
MAARLDPGGELARCLPLAQVVLGVVHSANEVIEPGVVRNTSFDRNRLIFGTPRPDSPVDVDAIVRLVGAAGYEAHASDHVREDLWQKMVLVVGVSSAAVLSDSDLGVLACDDDGRTLLLDLMFECAAIGKALGFTIPDDHAQRIRYFRDKPARPSLLQDFIARREPELDATILTFAALAEAAEVPVPKLRTVATLVRLRAEALGLRRAPEAGGATPS